MKLKTVYLILAIAGAAAPYYFFWQHFAASGFGFTDFVAALFGNGAAGGFTVDLLISSLVFWIAMLHRRSQGKGPHPGWFVLINLLVGLSCALPAYLYANTKD